ncbi:MAG: hypothetical protein U9M95_03625 [Candidatus Altiarchaeota archaeon]|nr:hypothetical protein [Candidatus Altiarchaeota archaeon]
MGLSKLSKCFVIILLVALLPLAVSASLQDDSLSVSVELDKNFLNQKSYRSGEIANVSIRVNNPSDYALTENCLRFKIVEGVPEAGRDMMPAYERKKPLVRRFYRCGVDGLKPNSFKEFSYSFNVDLPPGRYGLIVDLLTKGGFFLDSGGEGFTVNNLSSGNNEFIVFNSTEFTSKEAEWVKYARHMHVNEAYTISGSVQNLGDYETGFEVVYRLYRFNDRPYSGTPLNEKRMSLSLPPRGEGVFEFTDSVSEEDHYIGFLAAERDGSVVGVDRYKTIFTADRWAEVYELYTNNYAYSKSDRVEFMYYVASSGGRNDEVKSIKPEEAAGPGLTLPLDIKITERVIDEKGVVYEETRGPFLAQMDYRIPVNSSFRAGRDLRDFNVTVEVYDNDTGKLLKAQTIVYRFSDFVGAGEVSCFDGIQNQGEEDIDCGGPCEPCSPRIPWALIVVFLAVLGVVAYVLIKKRRRSG